MQPATANLTKLAFFIFHLFLGFGNLIFVCSYYNLSSIILQTVFLKILFAQNLMWS